MRRIDMQSELKTSVQQTVELDNEADFDPIEEALERCPWCLVCPDDQNVFGPFDSVEEAVALSRSYPYAFPVLLISPEAEVLLRRESEEFEAIRRPKTDRSTSAVQDPAASQPSE